MPNNLERLQIQLSRLKTVGNDEKEFHRIRYGLIADLKRLPYPEPTLEEIAMKTLKQKIEKALVLIENYGGIDEGHHKQWVIDQIVRILADDYGAWVRRCRNGAAGPNTYDWDVGTPP